MKLVLLSSDLMISARVEGAARQNGLTVVTAGSHAAALDAAAQESCRLLLVDLRFPALDIGELVRMVREHCEGHLPIVAFGPHVHEANLAAANAAGCDAVVTRGQFDHEAGAIIGNLISEVD